MSTFLPTPNSEEPHFAQVCPPTGGCHFYFAQVAVLTGATFPARSDAEHSKKTVTHVAGLKCHRRARLQSLHPLEAFRLRSEHASAITADMRTRMAARLIEEYGSPQAAADAVWALARESAWYREGEGAERFLLARPGMVKAPVNKAALELLVAWHGEVLGTLTHDGFEWRWKPQKRTGPALIRETAP